MEEVGPEFERTLISVALNKTKGKKKEAAELLGWGRNTLSRKIKELGKITISGFNEWSSLKPRKVGGSPMICTGTMSRKNMTNLH